MVRVAFLKPGDLTIGDAFAFPTGDRRFGVCRVVVVEGGWAGNAKALIATSSWIGAEVPAPSEPLLRRVLRLSHHRYANQPSTLWVLDRPPADLIPIGTIPPSDEDVALANACQASGRWRSQIIQPLLQWRWDHDRDALLAEDAENEKAEELARANAERNRSESLSATTLDSLKTYRFFPDWKSYPSKRAIKASRELMTNTVQRLVELGPNPSKKDRLQLLQDCIESFNDLDEKSHFIETIEREDICREFEAIVHACGLGSMTDLADKWRDW
jgi:hypothetical protein